MLLDERVLGLTVEAVEVEGQIEDGVGKGETAEEACGETHDGGIVIRIWDLGFGTRLKVGII